MKFSDLSENQIEKILLIKLGAVGDLVIASAFFDSLRKHFSQAQIVLLTGKTSFRTVENNPSIDRLLLVDDIAIYKGNPFSRFQETFRVIKLLRKESFDLVFVLHRSWFFNFLVFLSKIPKRVGFARGREGIMLTHRVIPQRDQNERQAYLELLRECGITANYQRSFFYLSKSEEEFLEGFLLSHNIRDNEYLIGIAPGGGKNVKTNMVTKRWPEKNYVALIRKILSKISCRVVLFGGPDDSDIVSRIQKANPVCLDASDLSFGEMASVFRGCRLLISNDSGPLHIASAMRTPTISFYGPTNPKEWAPIDFNDTVIYKQVECSPCYDQGRFPKCDHLKCLTSISVDEAWENVAKKLNIISLDA